MNFAPGSRARLNHHDIERFAEDTLFGRIARAVATAECLPRKELFESWAVARRVRRRLRGGRVVDLAAGHGLLAMMMLILDDSSPCAIVVDRRLPESARRLLAVIEEQWPRLRDRVQLQASDIDAIELTDSDVIVSAHACGSLTDRILERAMQARARVAVLPCCQATSTCDLGGLGGWFDAATAIDVTRAARLREHRYHIHTQLIPADITPKNRLLIGEPAEFAECAECAERTANYPAGDPEAAGAAPPMGTPPVGAAVLVR